MADNLFALQVPEPIIDESVAIAFAKKQAEEAEAKRIAEEKRKAAQAAKLTVKTAFPAGWCTSYAASRFPVTWRGNAGSWGANARAQGYVVDRRPEAGALVTTWENSRNCWGCGHVAYIDKVENGVMYISEMNFVAFGVVSYRSLPVNSPTIRDVIHRK